MSFIVREIKEEDFSKGFFETLSNLSEVGEIKNETSLAIKILNKINKDKNYKIIIAEDKENHQYNRYSNTTYRTKIYSQWWKGRTY